jgi:hypothetical protein
VTRRRCQPRIRGVVRLPKPAGLLPVIEHGLQTIARMEDKSLSWVLAEIISAYFNLDAATGHPLTEKLARLQLVGPVRRRRRRVAVS